LGRRFYAPLIWSFSSHKTAESPPLTENHLSVSAFIFQKETEVGSGDSVPSGHNQALLCAESPHLERGFFVFSPREFLMIGLFLCCVVLSALEDPPLFLTLSYTFLSEWPQHFSSPFSDQDWGFKSRPFPGFGGDRLVLGTMPYFFL